MLNLRVMIFILKYLEGVSWWKIAGSIFLLNLLAKSFFVTSQPIWYDECFSIFSAQGSIRDSLIVSHWDINPPFYYILLKFWMNLFGDTEFSVRFLNVLISSTAASVLFVYVRKFLDLRSALVASVLFLISDLLFYYSHEVRGYSLIVLCGLLASHLFLSQLQSPSILRAILLACCWYMLVMTNYLTLFILLVQGGVLLIYFNKERFKYFLYAIVAFIILIWHWTERIYNIITQGQHSAWDSVPTPEDFYRLYEEFLNGRLMLYFWIAILVLFGVFFIIQTKSVKEKISRYYSPMLVYSFIIGVLVVITAYFISFKTPMFLDRYLLFTLIGLVPLLSVLLVVTLDKPIYLGIGLVFIIALSIPYVTPDRTKGMNYREAMVFVKKKEVSNRVILLQTRDMYAL